MRLMNPTTIVLIRHAESERNKALNGALFLNDPTAFESIGKTPDHKISITEKGIQQAKDTGKSLYELIGTPDIVFHSGYTRTKQTAEHVFASFEHRETILFKEDLSIRERESGYTHTLLESEKEKNFPYLQSYWDIIGGVFARPIGGESLMDVIEKRLAPFLEKIKIEYQGKTVVLVTHGRVIQCFRFMLDEMTWSEMEDFIAKKENNPENCGVTIYRKDAKESKFKLEV